MLETRHIEGMVSCTGEEGSENGVVQYEYWRAGRNEKELLKVGYAKCAFL